MAEACGPNWLELYRKAVLERDREKLRTGVATAHKAVPQIARIVVRRVTRND
jgi:hypothetical protein